MHVHGGGGLTFALFLLPSLSEPPPSPSCTLLLGLKGASSMVLMPAPRVICFCSLEKRTPFLDSARLANANARGRSPPIPAQKKNALFCFVKSIFI